MCTIQVHKVSAVPRLLGERRSGVERSVVLPYCQCIRHGVPHGARETHSTETEGRQPAGTKSISRIYRRRCKFFNPSQGRIQAGANRRQWLKWFCEAGGGGSPDEARLEQTPYPFSNPTNLALFRHKMTLYRFNQGAHTIAGGSNGSRGLSPPSPPHFNQ